MKKNKNNPYVNRKLVQRIKHNGGAYYTSNLVVSLSPLVKEGLIAIAEDEGRSLSWVVNEVFKIFFGLRDDTEYLGLQSRKRRK